MERVSSFITIPKRKRVNQFYELCKFAAQLYNNATQDKVTPKRFMRDCSKNRRAYELAQIDFNELCQPNMTPQEKAKVYFGSLKKRKSTLE
jgi:hypothetical protein